VPPIDATSFDPADAGQQWICVHCERAIFDTFEEACEHEKICSERAKQAKDEKSNDENKSPSSQVVSHKNSSKPSHNMIENNAPNDIDPRLQVGNKIEWQCDFCDALFDTYQEAYKHEATCNHNPKGNSLNNDSKASSSTSTGNNNNTSNAPPQINVVPMPVLSSIENKCLKDILGKERLEWQCVYCKKSVFPTYQEALEHESKCSDNRANDNS